MNRPRRTTNAGCEDVRRLFGPRLAAVLNQGNGDSQSGQEFGNVGDFIDGLACLWNVTLGHGRKELAQAASKQMEQLAFTTSYIGHTNVPAVQLTEKLSALCYPSINHFFFSSGGGDANDSAIKTARFFWNSQGKPDKLKIIAREHGYHGVTIGSMNATGIPGFWPMFSSKIPGFSHI